MVILILYCEGLNLCHYRYGSNALSVDFYYCADLILVFVSFLDAELRLESYCTGQLALSSSHGGEEGGESCGESCREMQRQRFPSLRPSPTLLLHTVNTDNPGCRWRLHSATAVGWRWREAQLSVYKPVVFPRRCCCQMGFEWRGLVISDSTVCRFLSQPNNSRQFLLYSAKGFFFVFFKKKKYILNVL